MDKQQALIHYYAREGFYHQVQTVCNEFLKSRYNDPILVFWKASLGTLQEGSTTEAIRDLQTLTQLPDLELAASAAMYAAHESAKVQDQEAMIELQNKLDLEESSASDNATLLLATFYSYTSSKERARGLVEKLLRSNPDSQQAMTLLGWIIIKQYLEEELDYMAEEPSDGELEEALQNFEAVLEANRNNLEALMGRAKVFELRKNLPGAIEAVTEAHVKFSWFMPALIEKTRLLIALNDWDQAMENVNQILKSDPQNVTGIAWQALHQMTREGNNKAGAKCLTDLYSALQQTEPKNPELYYRLARPFARLAGGDASVLTVTGMMIEKACLMKPDKAEYLVEAGYNRLFNEEFTAASEKFEAALRLDELSLDANCGSLEAAIQLGKIDESMSQAAFLEEMFNSQAGFTLGKKLPPHLAAPSAEAEAPALTYLKALLAWKINSGGGEGLSLFERAIGGQFELGVRIPHSLDFYTVLNPGRVTNIAKILLSSVGGEPRLSTEAPSPMLSKCMRALELLGKYVPAMLEAQLLSARAQYLNGNLEAAHRKASDVLRVNPDSFMIHLLICSIYVHQDKPQLAMSALDQAVSSNFSVRETPIYHIVNSKVLIASGKIEDARKVLEAAMNLPGVKTPLKPDQKARLLAGGRKGGFAEPSLHERASIYLMLADVLGRLAKGQDAPEAKKYISDAIREFEGTSEEVRVTVADSEMAIARGDIEGALKKLRKIPKDSPHYTKARMAMADIFLRHRKDKASYVKCYLDLVDLAADYDTYCMLGEAFMQIQEPEKAVRAFESALEFTPKDAELMSRIARALVTTHDYQRAIDYYTKAIYISRGNWTLQLEVSTLLVRLRQWAVAITSLNKCLDRPRDNPTSTENLSTDVEAWTIMARVYKGSGDMDSYVEACMRALDLQKQLLTKMRGESLEALQAHRMKAAGICYDLAEYYNHKARKPDRAMELYNDALRLCDTHAGSLLALAQLHLSNGNLDLCQQQCMALLKAEPDNEEGSVMLAEIMFHKENYESAIFHFQQLMEKTPNHYVALTNLISLLRRAGRLDDVPKYFAAAEAASPKSIMDPGFHYCKGLHQRFVNNPREALKEFNFARKDTKWGGQALLHMVEIYLNPDNDAVWEEKENADTPESREAVATARSLMGQVRPQDRLSLRYKVLYSYSMMAGKDKNQTETALSQLLDLANTDPNNVPVLLALATGFMLLKQTPKARNQLKRVQKIPYKPDEGEEFEKSWLLLADIHIQGGKFDLAQELCQKCLKYNKSCAKAWEFMGAIMEREQSYKDAADHYEMAWKHENQASAAVGYKLAFNYLKAKRFVDAIDVCHKVIKAFPDYPKIKKDILEKAWNNVRV